jgi:hypothetical protein
MHDQYYRNQQYEISQLAPTPEGLRALVTLRAIYVGVGMNPEDALRSALADYTCHFLPLCEEELCAA